MDTQCSMCGAAESLVIGILGYVEWHRCRDCGHDFEIDVTVRPDELPQGSAPMAAHACIDVITTDPRMHSKSRRYKTLRGAQAYAQRMIGKTPEISRTFQYAVGSFGDIKIECHGCHIGDLFPQVRQ